METWRAYSDGRCLICRRPEPVIVVVAEPPSPLYILMADRCCQIIVILFIGWFSLVFLTVRRHYVHAAEQEL